jgi:hypothetical protein
MDDALPNFSVHVDPESVFTFAGICSNTAGARYGGVSLK